MFCQEEQVVAQKARMSYFNNKSEGVVCGGASFINSVSVLEGVNLQATGGAEDTARFLVKATALFLSTARTLSHHHEPRPMTTLLHHFANLISARLGGVSSSSSTTRTQVHLSAIWVTICFFGILGAEGAAHLHAGLKEDDLGFS
eukprot:TRINITY_DN58599_c0_g1_i11.p1 TRINITY_DN58599_c0_g1~~TRINITY_DN58599_c0_g1_i11.p1  ORF type:complete len:145 (+),score=37.26 TRINITY_DN58599_c0_g1_i11:93-527(+)